MSDYFDSAAAEKRYKLLDDDVLIKIAYDKSSRYVPKAVEMARAELNERGINSLNKDAIRTATLSATDKAREPEDGPLHPVSRALFFVVPFFGFAATVRYLFMGQIQKGFDTGLWSFLGFVAWMILKTVTMGADQV